MVLKRMMGLSTMDKKNTIGLDMVKMNLQMDITTLTELKTSGGFVKSGLQSSEGYINIRFICTSKSVNLDTIIEIKIYTYFYSKNYEKKT